MPTLIDDDFTEDGIKCREFIYALPGMDNPDFRVVRLRDEVAADQFLVSSTKAKLIDAGAKWLRITVDHDGDVIIEGWRSVLEAAN